MKFNWISTREANDTLKRLCIDLEYQLRPKITRFLMSRLEPECCGDFSCFYFDVDLESGNITLSDQTPPEFLRLIGTDFDLEFNPNWVTIPVR